MTSESASQLKTLLSKQLKRSVNHWGDLIVVMTVRKLDKSTQCEWVSQMCKEKMTLTFKMLQEFFEQQIVMLESPCVLPNATVNKKLVTNTQVHNAYSNACERSFTSKM